MKFYILFSIVFFPILVLAQSPWTPGKGKQYHQISFTTIPSYDKLHTSGEAYQLERFITDNTLQYYGEVGITNNFSVTAIVPLKFLKAGKLSDESTIAPTISSGDFKTLGNIEFAAKYNFYKANNFAFATSIYVGLPMAANQTNTGLRGGFNAWSLRPSLSVGFNQNKFYAYSFLAYAWNSNGFASNINFGLEGGVKVGNGFIVAMQFSAIQNLTDGTHVPTIVNVSSGLYLNGYEYAAITIKIIKEIIPEKLGLVGSLGGGTGNLVARAPALTLGVYTKL